MLDAVGISHVAQGEDALMVNAGQGRTHGRGTRSQEQLVVSFAVGAMLCILNHNDLGFWVNAQCLTLCPHVDAEPARKGCRRLHKQTVAVGNNPTYIIRQTAVGV